jgi:hypothetical protein
MTKKLFKNNNYLLNDSDDETETVEWIDEIDNKKYFDCGCCEKCLCDDNKPCENCGCNCNGEDYDEDCSEGSDDSDNDDDQVQINNKEDKTLKLNELANLSNFNIKIVESKDSGKKVRITLELNVMLDNKKNEVISIDLDINSSTYLKIAEELFKS